MPLSLFASLLSANSNRTAQPAEKQAQTKAKPFKQAPPHKVSKGQELLPKRKAGSTHYGEPDTLQLTATKPTLGIVDNYQVRRIPLLYKPLRLTSAQPDAPQDWIEDAYASHGQLVEAHALSVAPNIHIKRFQTSPLGFYDFNDINPALETVLEKVQTPGASIDAMNLSSSMSVPIRLLREQLDLPGLSPNNITNYQEDILRSLSKIRLDSVYPELCQKAKRLFYDPHQALSMSMAFLEEIAKAIPVFIAAGNDGPQGINLFSLTPGVKTIGAQVDQKPAGYSGNHALVKEWHPVSKKVIPVVNHQAHLKGFNLQTGKNPPFSIRSGDSKSALIPIETVHTVRIHQEDPWPNSYWLGERLEGTSFASPQAAALAITQKNDPALTITQNASKSE